VKIDKNRPVPKRGIVIPFIDMLPGHSVKIDCAKNERYATQIRILRSKSVKDHRKHGVVSTAFVGPDRDKPYHEKTFGVRVWRVE